MARTSDRRLATIMLDDGNLRGPSSASASVALAEGATAASRDDAAVAMVRGRGESLTSEVSELRRRRLAAVGLLLTVVYAILFVFNGLTMRAGSELIWLVMTLRVTLPAGVAAVLFSRVVLTRGQVRAIEFGLFGGLGLLLIASQTLVCLALLGKGQEMNAFAHVKNGVTQTFALMVIYGAFIPNDARTAAKVILALALTPLVGYALVIGLSEKAGEVEKVRSVEPFGTNLVYLGVGALVAIASARVLGGLRSELHEAKKFGQYQLGRKLGAGGMGEVYFAEHQLLKRPSALKLIRAEAAGDAVAVARFEREVQAAARLEHPNTIGIFDYGHTAGGTFYYVMEYLTGLSLSDLVAQHGALPPGRTIYLLRQACAGLAEAHDLGLVHRDLKPANVFVATRGGEFDVVKVLDFGLVKVQDASAPALTSDNSVSGTPLYMAPEQATGARDLDARVDVYALGSVAYFALTGRPPFEGETAFEVMMAHARDPVAPPSKHRPGLPADLEQVVLRCLAKNRQDRYPSVRALSEPLAACASSAAWGPHRAEAWWVSTAEMSRLAAEGGQASRS
jgi:eukaryotic-like serine/threonine-protein kinase